MAAAAPAYARADAVDFDIPAQPLSAALDTFAAQSRQPILVRPEITRGKTSAGVSGPADTPAALAQLLAGTGLTYRVAGKTFLIEEAADPQGGSAADGAEGTVEALIVTAQKREEDIQDVPIAISAFTQESLETHQIAGGPDLITQVPNMTFTKTNFASYSIQLRGIGTQAISATTDPGVAVAFNNTPFIRNRFFEQEFYDLQRVEVLRGPQGTLYGRNATAGVVNIISQKPKFIAEAKLSGDVSNYNTTRVEGMVNVPLVEDMVAVRLAGAWTKRDGYAVNELTGNPIDGRDLWSTRLSLRFAPSDRLDVNLIWEHFEEDDDRLRSGKQLCKKHVVTEVGGIAVNPNAFPSFGSGAGGFDGVQPTLSQGCIRESLYSPDSFQTPNGQSVPYYLPLGAIGLPVVPNKDPYASVVQSRDMRVIESTIDPQYRAKADLGELQVSFDLTDSLTLSSETAYSTDFVYSLQDFNRFNTAPGVWRTTNGADPASGPNALARLGILSPDGVFCDPQLGCSDRLVAVDISTAKTRNFSQEFRIGSDFEGPFNFSLGSNFLRYDTEDKYYVFINSLTLGAIGSFSSFQDFIRPPVPWILGVSDNRECNQNDLLPGDPSKAYGYSCVYIEPNPIDNIQDQGHNYFLSRNPYKLISYAAFGEAYYNLTENLKVTGGLRFTVDKKNAPLLPSWTFAAFSRGYPVMEVIEREWREPTGRLTIDWKPELGVTDETLLYGSYAHGYKAGGVNPPPMMPVGPSAESYGGVTPSKLRPKTFEAEFIDAFELGAKNALADGRVTLNLAAFYYDYKDYQISEIVDRSAFNKNFDAEVWGLEIEADWRPLENLKLGFKGGYENTRIADGEEAIDLMDRTAGDPDWIVVRPFPTFASSCILPTRLYAHDGVMHNIGNVGGGSGGGCEYAYFKGVDPVTNLPYVPNPVIVPGTNNSSLSRWPTGTYAGFDPSTAPNNGEGIAKPLGGNELPNAPNFTATLTADYTVPLAGDWLATLHTDLYWQSESWWRIFNDHEHARLDEYFTMNLAAILENEEAGWRVLAYVKNVFDRDSITGAFLNSDDTGLTTNIFLTEPRLYGLRVTKAWSGGPLLGSFGGRREGPYPFTLELGGQVQRHDAPNAPVEPSFIDQFSDAIDPLGDQQDDLDWGDGREVRLIWQASETWKVALGARFGKTNGSMPWSTRSEEGDRICILEELAECQEFMAQGYNPANLYQIRSNYSISTTADREEHTVVDFAAGKDIGIGTIASTAAVGVRYADVGSITSAHIFGTPNWDIPPDDQWLKYASGFVPNVDSTRDRYDAIINAKRQFKGVGPVLSWEASKALLGSNETGFLGLEWSLAGGVLFGERETTISGEERTENFAFPTGWLGGEAAPVLPDVTTVEPVSFQRSEDVTVPTFGASLGLSYKIDRFSIGAGYRWERYFDAIDGGYSQTQEEDRTIDGPYFKLSVGFGGG